ncbi:hypothetical protein FB451DRAFT_1388356 [Mycena latifolia]|nr:hypothetical protein FB451DRAFT_1388356 [Mycena latifolia]
MPSKPLAFDFPPAQDRGSADSMPPGEASSLEALKGVITLIEAAIFHFTDDIAEVLAWVRDQENPLRFSCRILSHQEHLLVLRVMPGPMHEITAASFQNEVSVAGYAAFGALWDEVMVMGKSDIELGDQAHRNVKQPDTSWGSDLGDATVVLEVSAEGTLAALRDGVGRWFTPGAATKLAIIVGITKRPNADPECTVEMYERASSIPIYRGAWHDLSDATPSFVIPLAAFFVDEAQSQVPPGAQIEIPMERMKVLYRAICFGVRKELRKFNSGVER